MRSWVHGLRVRPIDVTRSAWRGALEGGEETTLSVLRCPLKNPAIRVSDAPRTPDSCKREQALMQTKSMRDEKPRHPFSATRLREESTAL